MASLAHATPPGHRTPRAASATPPSPARRDLHRALPSATLHVIPDSGHSAFDVGNQRALLDATDALRASVFKPIA